MMNRKEFKNLLTEWKNLTDRSLLLEISRNEVIEVIGEDDYNILKTNKRAVQDQNFLKVIINTYKANQNHSIADILGLHQGYERFIKDKWNQGKSADVEVPGGLSASLEPNTTTYNSMLEFIDATSSMTLKSKAFIKCLKQSDINPDFEVVINDNEWIICYPKTIKGSISLARSFWNGEELEYDKTVSGGVGQNIGRMNWCTSNVSGGNMFLNYHRKLNLHMYYCIKKNMNIRDPDRKLCISFSKQDNLVKMFEGNASVNGNNISINKKESRSYIGSRFNNLVKDAKKPERLEIDEKSYYESISLEQYKILRAANEDNLQDFVQELDKILTYSKDKKEISLLTLKEKSKDFKLSVIRNSNLLELDPSGELIKKLASDEYAGVRVDIAQSQDLLTVDPSGELIKKLASDEDEGVRVAIAQRPDLLEADPSGELIKKLTSDEYSGVRFAIAQSQDLLTVDPSGELIKKLASDEKPGVRLVISIRPDLLEADPSGVLIKKLSSDEDERVRFAIAEEQDLLELDPSGELIKKLASDKDVRVAIARRQDLLEIDPSGELIKNLASVEDEDVRFAIAQRPDLLEADPSGELIKKLASDEYVGVRSNIAQRPDLLEADPSGELIKKLASDEDEGVRSAIANRYNISDLQETLLKKYINMILD